MDNNFYLAGEASYQDALQSNIVFAQAEVKEYLLARVAGSNPTRPQAHRVELMEDWNLCELKQQPKKILPLP
jgi:hypothetical protein